MKKRVFSGALLTLLVCVLFLAFPVQAESSRVFDEAGLFTQQEKQSLEELTKQYIEKTSLDLVIVTTDDTQGKSTRAYADDFPLVKCPKPSGRHKFVSTLTTPWAGKITRKLLAFIHITANRAAPALDLCRGGFLRNLLPFIRRRCFGSSTL